MLSVGLAHRYPERVKTLTLCNAPTTIGAAGQAFFAGEHASWQEAMEALGARGWVEWLISQPGTSIADFPEERAWILDQMSRTALDAMIGYSHVISRTDVAPLLPELSMPVLVLAPTRSSAAPLEGQHKMAEAIPNCRIAEIDARGHEVYWDRPDECIAALREHMSAAR
jgi:pimeloyl-ACP methyl ester carboxylesterase